MFHSFSFSIFLSGNRDTISKPDTLKYERPINRGFQARALSQFAPESKRRDRAAKAASPPKSPSKQKSESQANGKAKSPKKVDIFKMNKEYT